MTHRPSSWRDDLAPLALAALGALFLAGSLAVMLTTPTRFEEVRPTGPRVEITGTLTVPRPTTILPAPNAVIGDPCPVVAAVGSSVAGPVVCRVVGRELRWVLK